VIAVRPSYASRFLLAWAVEGVGELYAELLTLGRVHIWLLEYCYCHHRGPPWPLA